jgi:formate--tetrahydrofolate ligase
MTTGEAAPGGVGQHTKALSDVDIAQAARLLPILDVARDRLGIGTEHIQPYGHTKAKIDLAYLRTLHDRPDGRLTTVGLNDALNHIGKRSIACLREPSLGPCFGSKGGAAGGGYAQVVPMEDINLHFTGDFHAIGTANNLLAALIDNHIHWGNALDIDVRRITWKRALDMNDRALRSMTVALGGVGNGFPREDGFDITVASEVMAIFCLATDLEDLQRRLGNIVVGYSRAKKPVQARDIGAVGAMAVLLRDALAPNLVQSLEHNPVFVHGGPFANIAHGCNSVIATKAALKLADYVVTEAGFGADLGAEKFFDIKCRKAGLSPAAAVIVATIRALKMHGGVAKADLRVENLDALTAGFANLRRHVENVRKFGVPVVVAINRFSADTGAEIERVQALCRELGVACCMADHWATGGAGAAELARTVVATIEATPSAFKPLYPDELGLFAKLETVAREIYRADGVSAPASVRKRLAEIEAAGFGHLPVCVAKTQYSFSTDPAAVGAPTGYDLPVRDVRLSAGAEFVVAVCGDIMTMPGLPKTPAAASIGLTPAGQIVGLF